MSITKELITYLLVLWRHKWMIASCAILSSIVALGISLKLPPRYEATATVRVASASGGVDDYIYLISLTRLSNTYVEIASSDISLNEISTRLGLQEFPKVQIETVPDTELIVITATNPDPTLARDIANTLANQMVEQSTQLYGGNAPTMREILEGQLQQAKVELDTAISAYDDMLRQAPPSPASAISGTPLPNTNVEAMAQLVGLRQQIYNELLLDYEEARTNEQLRANAITIVESADLPEEPALPGVPLNTALGFAAGFAVGVILAFLYEGMDDSVHGIEDVTAMTTLPVLSKVTRLKHGSGADIDLTVLGNENYSPAPVFDQLCARLKFFDATSKFTTMIITSPEPETGTSAIAANIALSLAQRGKEIVLVDLDFHRPPNYSYLGLPGDKGLRNFLLGEIQWDETLQTTANPHLRIITTGACSHAPDELWPPGATVNLIETLRSQAGYVLIDSPDLPGVIDPSALIPHVDAIILVITLRKTQRQNFRYALQQIGELKADTAGIILYQPSDYHSFCYSARRILRTALTYRWKEHRSDHNLHPKQMI
jgi:capsular exopolysaccharide synthesis family protein